MENLQSFELKTLLMVLSKAFGQSITDASVDIKQLHGGTLGDVKLVFGIAKSESGQELPYKVVHKTQKKWERHGDPDSWRREYDLYASKMDSLFSDSFRWPKCYHAERTDEEAELWMEYIHGVSSFSLTTQMYVRAAEELGRFQGRLFTAQPDVLQTLGNLSKLDLRKNAYLRYRSWGEVYDSIRSKDCEIPAHLCKMLIDFDEHADEIWSRIEGLPVVFCHRDFWVANIFYADDKIILIDWDTSGFGYLGEDLASLIADEADVTHMALYYEQCVPAYYKGFAEYAELPHIEPDTIKDFILIMFGYRLVEWFKFAKTDEEKSLQLETLQKIYEMGNNDVHG